MATNYIHRTIEDPETFLRTHGIPLIIDEFQYAPNLLSYIKLAIDEARKNEMFGYGKKVGTLYYLTGTQVFETMENITESLAGRVGIIDLYPLSTREISSSTEEILHFSIFPNIPIKKIYKKQTVKP